MHLLYAEAARSMGNHLAEFEALALHIQLLSRQGNSQEAEQYLPRFRELAQSIRLSADLYFTYYHTLALYWMSQDDLNAAHDAWRQSLAQASGFSAHSKIGNLQWLATCLYHQGKLAEAQELYKESLDGALQQNYQRFVLINQFRLALIDLDQHNLIDAENHLAAANDTAYALQDREYFARIHRLEARLNHMRGDTAAAKQSLAAAIDLFERLGLRQELTEARAALAQLEARVVAPADEY
jgi:tetratricopeptide (TPR) repeat protein